MIRTKIRTNIGNTIRATMTALALGSLALTGATAMAAPVAAHRHGKTAAIVASADTARAAATPASDTAAKPAPKKIAKKAHVTKQAKDRTSATEGASPAPAATPAPEKMPEKK